MSNFLNLKKGLALLAVLIAAVLVLNINGCNSKKVTRIYEGSNVSQPYILFTLVGDKIFKGFSGSTVIREIKDGEIFRVDNGKPVLIYSIKGDEILDAYTNNIVYSINNNIIYKGSKVDTSSVLLRIRPNGWIMDKDDRTVIYTCEGECNIRTLASTILLK